ncbi:hypothetical protein H7271_02255 [Bittarella massiliensis]|uniref:KGG domain-containing protein n=1 Tax=Bittarella massiliensis (ex Durand et al. 2017) TaxID=1720313 RepID=UPI00163CDCD6|nr:hypothetical protein [Bittarella massiliensis (ex Durand et al. 2017)]
MKGRRCDVDGRKNLIPLSARDPQERREIARKGGLASGAARRRKRTFGQVFAALLPRAVALDGLDEIARLAEGLGPVTAQEAIALALICKAMKGDTPAFNAIRDTLGEKPGQKVEGALEGRITLALAGELDEFAQ